jgi:S-adenosylmethionine hydrolase
MKFYITVLFFSYNRNMEKHSLITIMTDFGNADPFAGIMRGVISSIVPSVTVMDLANEIPPGDILRGAIALWQAWTYFPGDTVFLCVVDPGVGTARRGIILKSGDYTFVGPDNGLFTFVMGNNSHAWELSNPEYSLPNPGSTFHGRDIFAPGAAYAALGVPGQDFGPSVIDPVLLPIPRLERQASGSLAGEILFADRFGNLLTSLGQFQKSTDGSIILKSWLAQLAGPVHAVRLPIRDLVVELGDGTILHWTDTFAQVPPDSCAFLVGSSGLIEIVANQQSAAEKLGLQSGDPITLRLQGELHG